MKSSSKKSTVVWPRVIDCGLADYALVLERQHELREKRRLKEIPDTVLVVEHRPVVTLGARQSANKLLAGRRSGAAAAQPHTIPGSLCSTRSWTYRNWALA